MIYLVNTIIKNKKVSATADRSSDSICVKKFGGVVDHAKIFPSSSLIIIRSLVSASHTACRHVGSPKDLGAETLTPGIGILHDPVEIRSPHVLQCRIWSL